MEEEIFIVESFLKNKKMLLKHPVWVSEQTLQAIENLINKCKEEEEHIEALNSVVVEHIEKNKEQEKIIELMAKEMSEEDENFLYRNTSDIIDYFKKKAKGE